MPSARLLLPLLLTACATATPVAAPPASKADPAPAKPVAVAEARPADAPLAEAAETARLERLLAGLRQPSPLFAEVGLKARVARLPRGSKGDVQEVYRKVAPATVLVRSATGFGTGVIIDPSGFVLTNHHVAASGLSEDFRLKVWVETGKLSELGVMEKAEAYEAYVHKSDPLLDLAVVKILDPPEGLPSVKVSRKDPMPGEAVSALGNGGIGLLWAIKDGEISSMGKLSTHLAQLAGAECVVSADPVAAAACTRSMKELDSVKRTMEEKIPGLVIQSSCTISPGDSGGPLVNRAGELVGLNAFLRSDRSAPVAANFHIHVTEIRKFLTEVPAAPARRVPDPWQAAGTVGVLADADLDGKIDTLAFGDLDRAVSFFDLDESSLLPGAPLPSVSELASTRRFDAEVAVMQTATQVLVWYDTDNDGRFDRLSVSTAASGGKADLTYELPPGAEPVKLSEGKGGALFAKAHLAAPAQGERLERIAAVAFPAWSSAPAQGEEAMVLPDPLWGGGRTGVPADTDLDGKLDSIWTLSPFSAALLVDTDQSVLGGLRPVEVGRALDQRAVGADASLIIQGSKMWSFLDTDRDDRFDLALFTSSAAAGAATQAFHLEDGKLGAAAPEHLGRKLIRPELLGTPEAAARLRNAVRRYYPSQLVAGEDALGSFPSPLTDVGSDIDFEDAAMPGWEDAVVSIIGDGAASVLIDLDRDTFKAKKNQREVAKVVAAGQFKAEFAWVGRGGMEWAFYDSDRDGKYDLVLFSAHPATGASERAYRIDKKGKVSADLAAATGKMLRPSVFRKGQREPFRTLAETFFRPEQVEE